MSARQPVQTRFVAHSIVLCCCCDFALFFLVFFSVTKALKCPTQDEMELIAAKALERDMPMYLVEDAGRTQIAAGSRTVLGIGPAPAYVFEDVTSHLKLM